MRWCDLCNRNIQPKKAFNGIIFVLLILFCFPVAIGYIVYYAMKKPVCPICGSGSEFFGPPRLDQMGRSD